MCPDVNHFLKPRNSQSAENISRQLRELPEELPAPYDFAEFSRRGRDRMSSRRTLVKWPHAAAAATLTAVVAGMAMLANGSRPDGPAIDLATESASVSSVTGAQVSASSGMGESRDTDPSRSQTSVARSAEQSRATREWLARQPPEPALVRVVPRIAVANLEDRIAWFDDTLNEERLDGGNADHVKVLQQERARLVASLAQVRYAESLVADGS
jgi:hypothetical protein